MSRDGVEAVVRQLFDAHNLRNAALLDELFTSDYV
jgi:hypothetical protein